MEKMNQEHGRNGIFSRRVFFSHGLRFAGKSAVFCSISRPYLAKSQPQWRRFAYSSSQGGVDGSLSIIRGIPVLIVQGSDPFIQGRTVGKLALSQASGILSYPKVLLTQLKMAPLWPLLVSLGERMVRKFPKRFQIELDSMQKSSGVDRDALVVGNTVFDLKQMVLCSGIAVEKERSATGGGILARNLDYPPFGDIGQYTLVQVIRQGGGMLAYASVGFPGILGVLSGINEAGLALAIHEVIDLKVGKRKYNPQGLPYALCYRMVLEKCQTVDEAKSFLEKLERTTTTNLLISDRKKAAVFEVTPDKILVRPVEMGAVCCTNHFCLPDHLPDNPLNPFRSFERKNSMETIKKKNEKIGIDDMKKMLDGANLGDHTLQSIIFECEPLKVHLAYGKPPASTGPYRDLDLKPLLSP